MKLRFTPRAIADLEAIADYLCVHDLAAASRVRDTIYKVLQNLLIFPRLGRLQTEPNVRKLVTPRFAYLIYYMLNDDYEEVIILTVKHSAQLHSYQDD